MFCVDGLSWVVNERFSVPRSQSVPGCELEAPVVSCLVLAENLAWSGARGSDVGNIVFERGQEHVGSIKSVR